MAEALGRIDDTRALAALSAARRAGKREYAGRCPQFFIALDRYAGEHNGALPETLEELAVGGYARYADGLTFSLPAENSEEPKPSSPRATASRIVRD